MKKIQRTVALIVGIICLLSLQHLSAQEYKVSITLGKARCGAPINPSNPTLSNDQLVISGGTIKVGSDGLSSQTASLDGKVTNSGMPIFEGSFSTEPTFFSIQIDAGFTNPGGQCAITTVESQSKSIISAIQDPGSEKSLIIPLDGGGALEVLVTAISFTLLPGTIGPDQTVCENEDLTINPITINSLVVAQGSREINYSWEYATSENGFYSPVDPPSTEVNYQISSISETRWYRRVASLGDKTERTEPVKIEVLPENDLKYKFELFLTGYECRGELDNVQRDLTLTFGSESIGIQELTLSSIIPVYEHDFDAIPVSFNLSSAFSDNNSGQCPGTFLRSSLALPPINTGIVEYELTQGSEKLTYTIRLTEVESFTLPGGEIEIDGVSNKIICLVNGLLNFTEKVASGVEGAYYEWQFSTNEGRGWNSLSESNSIDLSVAYPGITTWYRRVLYKGCEKGVTNTVIIEVERLAVDFQGLDAHYEHDATAVTLIGIPSGGVFSGSTGLSGTTFNPALSERGEVMITYTYTSALGCEYTKTKTTFVEPTSLCSTRVPLDDAGEFLLDKFSGRIVYKREEDCTPYIEIPCIQKESAPPILENVVSASAVTLADEWDYTSYTEPRYNTTQASANTFETGVSGKWRVQNSYVYRSSEVNRDKNYNTGTFDLPAFNWQYEDVNEPEKWIRASSVVKYSPNGEALEEYNAIGISSTVKMGYYGALPYLTAQNAKQEAVIFESFEVSYNGKLESGTAVNSASVISNTVSHAGLKSLELDPSEGVSTPLISNANTNGKMLVQFWAKSTPNESFTLNLTAGLNRIDVVSSETFTEIARSGDWGLYQTTLESTGIESFIINIVYTGAAKVWVDDLRVQPFDAEMSCYVYDPETLRLLTIFDGQHFGLYYQYDGEGKLVRKMIETERGIRTVQETFYNVPKVSKEQN